MAITVRYDDAGLLGSLASRVGYGEGRAVLADREQAMVRNVRDYYQQQDRLALEARRLQQAVADQRRQSAARTPTARIERGPTPFSRSVEQARDEQRNEYQAPQVPARPGTGEIGGPQGTFTFGEDGQLTGQRRYIDPAGEEQVVELDEEQVRKQLGGFTGPGRTPPPVLPHVARKLQFLEGLNIPDDVRATLRVLAEDPSVDLESFAIRAENAARPYRPASRAQMASLNVQGIDREIRAAQEAVEQARRALQDAGVDPADPNFRPADLNPQVRDTTGSDFFNNYYETYGRRFNPYLWWNEEAGASRMDVETGGNRAALTAYTQYQQALNRMNELQQQRQAVIQQAGQGPQVAPNTELMDLLQGFFSE